MCAVLVSDGGRDWPDGPRRPPLLDDVSVHVWRADLEQSPELMRAHLATLSPDERQRAGRFHFDKDRRHFIAARGVLRDLVGRYVGRTPAAVSFSYGRHGKPELGGAAGATRLAFNVSHSHGVALYAFTRGAAVGLDVEFIRDDVACLEVAEHTFSTDEVKALRALPAASRVVAFFDCWVRKEAYVKARGEGLSHDLRGFTVSLAPGATTALLAASDGPTEAARWSLAELPVGAGYAGALAVRLPTPRTTLLKWCGL